MGEVRDWRQSYRDLGLDGLKGQPEPAASVPVRLEPVFPPDISIPPPMGAAIIGIPLVPAPKPQIDAEADLILPAPEPQAKPKAKPAKRKAAARSPAKGRKPAAKKRPAAKAKPRKAAARKPKESTAPRAAAKLAASPAPLAPPRPSLPLPPLPQPAELAPLPRHASITPYRKGGLFAAMGFWLRNTVRSKHAESERELVRLRAENESLRRQIEALTALREASEYKLLG